MCKSQNPLYRYRLSVSADKEKKISVYYRYRPIRKFNLSAIIGIGRYEKMLIDHTLLIFKYDFKKWYFEQFF